MAPTIAPPARGHCFCWGHKTCTRIVALLGLILANGNIVLMSVWIHKPNQRFEAFTELGSWAHGIYMTVFVYSVLVFSVLALVCNILLLVGNEKEGTGYFWPWEFLTVTGICFITILLVMATIVGKFKCGTLLFFGLVIIGAMLSSVQTRHWEVKAKKMWDRGQLEGGVQLPRPRRDDTCMANNQAGFVRVNASIPNNQTGFIHFGASAAAPSQAGFVPMNASMPANQGVFTPMNATVVAQNQPGFVPTNASMPNNQAIPPTFDSSWPRTGELGVPLYPILEPLSPY